jgi:hypothetical protein
MMNKKQIADTLRSEIGELDVLIGKLKGRSDRMKQLVITLDEELAALEKQKEIKSLAEGSKFRKVIDSVFGEKPRPRDK